MVESQGVRRDDWQKGEESIKNWLKIATGEDDWRDRQDHSGLKFNKAFCNLRIELQLTRYKGQAWERSGGNEGEDQGTELEGDEMKLIRWDGDKEKMGRWRDGRREGDMNRRDMGN